MSKVLNLEENEADQLADFLGHDIRDHREYYHFPEGTLQLAKMSKVLMAMEKGTLSDFKRKNWMKLRSTLMVCKYVKCIFKGLYSHKSF